MTNDDDREEVFALLRSMRQQVDTIVPKDKFETNAIDAVILGIFWRSVRLFDAITILLEKNLPEEASALARSSFEGAMLLQELGHDFANRVGLVLRFVHTAIQNKRGFIHETARLKPEAADGKFLTELDEEERRLFEFARAQGIKKLPKFLSTKAAAEKFERRDDLWYYEATHEFVHGSDIAISPFRHRVSGDEVALFGRTTKLWLIGGVATFASLSLVQALQGVARILDWKGVERVAAIQDQFGPLLDRVKARRS